MQSIPSSNPMPIVGETWSNGTKGTRSEREKGLKSLMWSLLEATNANIVTQLITIGVSASCLWRKTE